MAFYSTRNNSLKKPFSSVLFAGTANDGGLYYPNKIPTLPQKTILSFNEKSYSEIALAVIYPFLKGEIPKPALKKIIDNSYNTKNFSPQNAALLKKITPDFFLLELFHGPTLAFKDFALQFLSGLIDYFLKKNQKKIIILGATSGDTGSASIQAFKKIKAAEIFILHPHKKVSLKQRLQMTTEDSANVHNLALKGNFDDCQNVVKAIFKKHSVIKNRQLVSVNSINFFRLVPQIVYYFYAFSRMKKKINDQINFVVPTGNFGDIFAGYLAKSMGLPIKNLIVATNENDILHRFLNTNLYVKKKLKKTHSPSMNIVVASNFERLLFHVYNGDSKKVKKIMEDLVKKSAFTIDEKEFQMIKETFSSIKTSNAETLKIIEWFYQKHKKVIDPHTATAVKWLYEKEEKPSPTNPNQSPTIALATAHPTKFDEVYNKIKTTIKFKDPLKNLLEKKENFDIIENSEETVEKFIQKKLP